MFLSNVDPIRLGLLSRAVLSFIELSYLEIGPDASLYDDAFVEARQRAIHDFQTFLDDEPETEQEVRRALLYLLNLEGLQFEQRAREIKLPLPRWAPADAHRLLVEIWERTWGGWRIPRFDAADFDVTTDDGRSAL